LCSFLKDLPISTNSQRPGKEQARNCSIEQDSLPSHGLAVSNPTIIELQRHLREKFPGARHGVPRGDASPIGERSDFRKPENFPRRAVTEVTPTHVASGLSLFLAGLLETGDSPSPFPEMALLDGCGNFDPGSFTTPARSRLLWARCETIHQTFQAADLLLRDGNIPLILMDLVSFPINELRRIPGSSWHRLKQLCESTDSALLALTPLTLIPCAKFRLALQSNFQLRDLDCSRAELLDRLEATPMRARKSAY
jgi:hypothetical protein